MSKRRSHRSIEYHYQPSTNIKKSEAVAYRKTFLIVLISIGILAFLYFWGLPFVGNIYNVWSVIKGTDQTQDIVIPNDVVIVPTVNMLPRTTNQSAITISGQATAGNKVRLYAKNNLISETDTNQNGSYSFTDVPLSDGDNSFSVSAYLNGTESQKLSISINLNKTPPTLTVDKPTDKALIADKEGATTVEGITEPSVYLTVNDHQVIIADTGKFSYAFVLVSGENKIKVVAKDEAGNTTTIERTVTYTPPSSETTNP